MAGFEIYPLASDGSPDTHATVWYVKDSSDFIHCKCFSPENASAVLKHMIDLDNFKKHLKLEKCQMHYLLDDSLLVAYSNLSNAVIRFTMHGTLTVNPDPPAIPVKPSNIEPASQPGTPALNSKPPI